MKRNYVTFEQAKLLKEKGCTVECTHGYYKHGTTELILWLDSEPVNTELAKVPEHWQVVEWLRIQKSIWVKINPTIIEYNNSNDTIKWTLEIYNLPIYLKNGKIWGANDNGKYIDNTYYGLPQEAYSAAFDYILKELI